jgi:transposase/IS5 family transposase
MSYLTGYDRQQAALFTQSIDELISIDSPVRLIDLFVDSLDLKQLGFVETGTSDTGRPSYRPADLFKLYIYGYLNRVRTSRLLERECQRNIEVMWLLHGLQPCFRTIAGFRSENPQGFRNVFTHFVKQLNKSGLIGGNTVAIDSSKFRAVNSKKNNYNQAKIERQLSYIDDKINNYISDLDQGDLTEDQEEQINQKIKKQRQRKRKYKRLEKQLRESGEDQISTTDPDARSMILHGSVIEVAFNVQTSVDDKHKLVVDYEPTNVNDRKALLNAALKAKEACGVKKITVLADKGYHNAEQIDSCTNEGITTYVSPQDAARGSDIPTPEYYGEKFNYNKRNDSYTCPQGHVLKTNGRWYAKTHGQNVTQVKHYKTNACSTCKVKYQCTRNKHGRLIERSEYAESVEKNDNRVKQNLDIYRKRQEIIEHIFGTIKRQWGYDHILLKGLEKNNGEFGLIYLIYNFRRIVNILDDKMIKKWLKSLFKLNLVLRSLMDGCRNKSKNLCKVFLIPRIVDYRFLRISFCTN